MKNMVKKAVAVVVVVGMLGVSGAAMAFPRFARRGGRSDWRYESYERAGRERTPIYERSRPNIGPRYIPRNYGRRW